MFTDAEREVFTMMKINFVVFWTVAACSISVFTLKMDLRNCGCPATSTYEGVSRKFPD
jgi:hypothetical protein